MARITGTYYWVIKNRQSRAFKNITDSKKYFKDKLKTDKSILGRNGLYYVKNILTDIQVGYYGISGKWWRLIKK